MKTGIYRYKEHFHRMGSLTGLFLADDSSVARIRDATIVVDDKLGKHSVIELTLDETCLTLVSDDPAHVEFFAALGLTSGFNPFDYWDDGDFESEDA